MPGQIRLNFEGLESTSGNLKTKGQELEEWIGQVDTFVRGLMDCWEGEAANAYIEQFDRLKPGLNETRQLIADIATQIDQTLTAAQELDNNIASKLR